MKINIYNNQSTILLSKRSIQRLVREILQHEGRRCSELSLYFVDENTIRQLHKNYFQDDSVTDCISFPIDPPTLGNDFCFLGEIFICTDKAVQYAKDMSLNPFDETALYIIHGLMHLLGFDDISKKDKTIMRKKEKNCMTLIKAKKLGVSSKHIKQLNR